MLRETEVFFGGFNMRSSTLHERANSRMNGFILPVKD